MPDRTPTRGRQAARERIAAKRAAEQEAERLRRRRRTQLVTGVAVAAAVVVAVLVAVLVQSARTDTGDAVAPANTAAGTAETGFARGSADAPVVVDVYEDYLCPACRAFEEAAGDTLDQLVADGEVVVRHRPVAILDRLSDDEYSTRAAGAAAVVADAAGVDAFATFSGLLFAQQPAEGGPGLTDDELIALAAQAGATGDDVEAGIRDRRFGDWVAEATDRASRDGLTGTPWILVDGDPLASPTVQALTAAVEAARG
ncbi:thioredoxin domain-containing protein [Blastococcus sp. TF02A-26]|uniref:DsbA family protein n=1 Tax=Blastococcus sp. TF02A-26 TaxID=2250577 RepID=UPI000DE86B48|nr:thioredoxin domain-containing protein [Blastococcus sp. TF02A-26]RBY86905.1 disulfide bond formation protein DsbA [Blastococcus sp. TF02A-26]